MPDRPTYCLAASISGGDVHARIDRSDGESISISPSTFRRLLTEFSGEARQIAIRREFRLIELWRCYRAEAA